MRRITVQTKGRKPNTRGQEGKRWSQRPISGRRFTEKITGFFLAFIEWQIVLSLPFTSIKLGNKTLSLAARETLTFVFRWTSRLAAMRSGSQHVSKAKLRLPGFHSRYSDNRVRATKVFTYTMPKYRSPMWKQQRNQLWRPAVTNRTRRVWTPLFSALKERRRSSIWRCLFCAEVNCGLQDCNEIHESTFAKAAANKCHSCNPREANAYSPHEQTREDS